MLANRTVADPVVSGDVVTLPLSAGNGGTIAAAVVSEFALGVHGAQLVSDTMGNVRGPRREPGPSVSPIAYIQRRIRQIVAEGHHRERPS